MSNKPSQTTTESFAVDHLNNEAKLLLNLIDHK